MPGARMAVPLALLLLAAGLVLNTLAIYLVIQDHHLASHWLARPGQAPASVIRTLDREFDLRVISRLLVSVVLIVSAMVILTTERKLRRMRLVAVAFDSILHARAPMPFDLAQILLRVCDTGGQRDPCRSTGGRTG
jgi:hypothetical protein